MRLDEFKHLFPDDKFSDAEVEFLKQSNYIESEYSNKALIDAMAAWDYMRNCSGFNITNLLHCHYMLLKDINFGISGKIRNQDIWIGGCLRPFISTELITNDLEYLFNKMNRHEIEPKEAHTVFEYIHPFVDGNGRVGRIIWQAHRLQLGLPIQIICEKDKYEYYKWF